MLEQQNLDSIVNQVSLITTANATFVRKNYFPKSLGLGIPIDIRRSKVETRVLECLPILLTGYEIHTPKILSVHQNQLEMDYIEGKTLCFHKNPYFASNEKWRGLGRWLAAAEVRIFNNKSSLFADLHETQENSAEIMAKIKTPGISPKTEKGSISLGDVGLKNILWTGRFHPLDFEFCHESSPGRDVGQLSAHMQATWRDSAVEAIKWLTMGYADGGGSAILALRWQSEFFKYYDRR